MKKHTYALNHRNSDKQANTKSETQARRASDQNTQKDKHIHKHSQIQSNTQARGERVTKHTEKKTHRQHT